MNVLVRLFKVGRHPPGQGFGGPAVENRNNPLDQECWCWSTQFHITAASRTFDQSPIRNGDPATRIFDQTAFAQFLRYTGDARTIDAESPGDLLMGKAQHLSAAAILKHQQPGA